MLLLSSWNTVGKRLREGEGAMQPLESPKRKMQFELISGGYPDMKKFAWLPFSFSF